MLHRSAVQKCAAAHNRHGAKNFILLKARERTMYENKTLVCMDCGEEFIFTAGEQEFYAEQGYQNEPKRCKPCRQKKKGTFKPQREYTVGVCANCGGEARVPFVPREGEPIYCSVCHEARKAAQKAEQ